MVNRVRVIIDTDPGIDDALAILLLAASPEISIEAITVTHGNTNVDKCARNALQIAELAGLIHIPIAKGANAPLVKSLTIAEETHGDGGLGYAVLPEPELKLRSEHAVHLMISLIHQFPQEIIILAIGPMTNLALAIRLDPSIVGLIKRVVSMGGAINYAGNMTPSAEYNVFCDPHAYDIVVRSGVDLTIVPLDVTYKCLFQQKHLDRLSEIKPEIRKFISDSTRFYIEFHNEYQGIEGCAINDPLAAAILMKPELVKFHDYYLTVELGGWHTTSKTSVDFFNSTGKPPNTKVAMEVDVEGFMDFFIERMKAL